MNQKGGHVDIYNGAVEAGTTLTGNLLISVNKI